MTVFDKKEEIYPVLMLATRRVEQREPNSVWGFIGPQANNGVYVTSCALRIHLCEPIFSIEGETFDGKSASWSSHVETLTVQRADDGGFIFVSLELIPTLTLYL